MTSTGKEQTADLQVALRQTTALMTRDPALAEQQAREILKSYAGETNALRLLGRAHRLQGRIDQALETIDLVIKHRPDSALAQQELGLILRTSGNADDAGKALRKALKLQPDLPEAWKALGELLAIEGDEEGSQEAYRRHLEITVEFPELIRAANYLHSGQLAKAEHLCRDFLKKHPANVSAIRILADTGIRLGALDDAQNLLERCLELAPDFHLARHNYVQVLYQRQRFEQAMMELEKLLWVEPDNPAYLLLKAAVLVHIGEHSPAIDIYERVLTRYPRQAMAQLSYGHALKTVGRQDDAIQAYRNCIALQAENGEAYWSLANLKTFKFEAQELESMKTQVVAERTKQNDYYHLCFAIGKSMEDSGQHDDAFKFYQLGNDSRRQETAWNADENHLDSQRLIDFFDAGFFAERSGQGCPDPDPVFIVGLPRSGSTLIEQILASHSQVEGTGELANIIATARRLSGKRRRNDESKYPQVLAGLSDRQFRELGEEYISNTRIQRSGNTPFFIDKMPNNFSHVGLIHLMLPNARIVDARRHPMACCFSGFKQLFARGQAFTYNLQDLGRYYRDYVELMDHWDEVLPGRILRLQYEQVVDDLENQVKILLDYCGLPFEEQCLKFYDTQRAVRTASSEQVRQPIYAEALEQWRYFEDHLAGLKESLGPVLDRYPE